MKRTVLKITGESGMGLASAGEIISRTLKQMGFYIHSDREYPSLIKGGHSNMQIDFGTEAIHSLSTQVDLVIALDRVGLVEYLKTVKEGGVLVHGYERHHLIKDLHEEAEKRKVTLVYLPSRQIAYASGGTDLMVNMVLLGLMWRVLGFELRPLEDEVTRRFKSKPKLLEIDLKCVRAGYEAEGQKVPEYKIEIPKKVPDKILINGNMALTLGAIQAGTRAYYAYPMSPSSSILSYMADFAKDTGMVVKQAEDEITAAQMAIGSMFMGARALVATSGGGYDLMTETVSLAGMIETPLVIVIAQRPGPATGLPTWTAQGDLNLAIHAGHGEYPKVVIAVSDPASAYDNIQHALNFAEEFQTPVLVLTEKVTAETVTMVNPFKHKEIPIRRGLVMDEKEMTQLKSEDRFKITESGLSRRWLPGSDVNYYGNSDEHQEDGVLTEESEACKAMMAKRMRKMTLIEQAMPEPKLYGPEKAEVSLVGWGSTLGPALDAIRALESEKIEVNYLHYEFMWPLKTKAFEALYKSGKKVCILEGNYTGQLAQLLEAKTGLKFYKQFLKYDGRPFFLEEIIQFVKNL